MLDSGCTNHMTEERSMFLSYSPMSHSNENIVFGDNSKEEVIGLGKVAITLEHSITNVLHVDSLSYNLLSISQLCEMGYNCLFMDKGVEVYRREDSSIVFMGQLKNKLYLVDFNKSVFEFGPIITSHLLNWETKLLLCSSNKCLHFLLNLALVIQKEYPSETGIIINNNKTIFVTPET